MVVVLLCLSFKQTAGVKHFDLFNTLECTCLVTSSSVAVDRQSHDALLAVVARLEAALEDVRRDVTGLSGCRDSCRRLDRIQQTVSEATLTQT